MKHILSAMSLVLFLAACSATQPSHQHATEQASHQTAMMPSHDGTNNISSSNAETHQARYACENGAAVTVRYTANSATVSLDIAEQTVTLSQVVSGSGSRYASRTGFYGKPSEWHVKGMQAHLSFSDPYGNDVETVCQEK